MVGAGIARVGKMSECGGSFEYRESLPGVPGYFDGGRKQTRRRMTLFLESGRITG